MLTLGWRFTLAKTKIKPTGRTPYPERREHASIYLPDALRIRLAKYMVEKFRGRLNSRNDIILDAIEDKLRKEGY